MPIEHFSVTNLLLYLAFHQLLKSYGMSLSAIILPSNGQYNLQFHLFYFHRYFNCFVIFNFESLSCRRTRMIFVTNINFNLALIVFATIIYIESFSMFLLTHHLCFFFVFFLSALSSCHLFFFLPLETTKLTVEPSSTSSFWRLTNNRVFLNAIMIALFGYSNIKPLLLALFRFLNGFFS